MDFITARLKRLFIKARNRCRRKKATAAPAPHFRFLDLPPEIRLTIYDYYFLPQVSPTRKTKKILISGTSSDFQIRGNFPLALLKTNRRIHQEALLRAAMGAHLLIMFRVDNDVGRLVYKLPIWIASRVERVCLLLGQFTSGRSRLFMFSRAKHVNIVPNSLSIERTITIIARAGQQEQWNENVERQLRIALSHCWGGHQRRAGVIIVRFPLVGKLTHPQLLITAVQRIVIRAGHNARLNILLFLNFTPRRRHPDQDVVWVSTNAILQSQKQTGTVDEETTRVLHRAVELALPSCGFRTVSWVKQPDAP